MSILLPKLRVRQGLGVGNDIWVEFPDISANEKTFFDADEASGQTALSANGTNFSVGQYVVLGTPGTEHCEIVRIHTSTAPTSTVITLASATTFAHTRGERIQFIPYNQVDLERSTDTGSTYSNATTVAIRADALETYIQRASDSSTDYYRARFKNSADTTYSSYSDGIVATGPAANSQWSIKNRALRSMGEKISGLITDEFLNEALYEGRREVDQDPRIFRWSFRTKFNTDIGDCIPGRWSIAVPSDLRDKNTQKNILGLRIGRQQFPAEYQDRARFNENYRNIAHTTLNGQILSSDTSITLTSSGDFDESGTVYVAAESVAAALDPVAYTANNEATNVLSGVTGIAVTHASGRDVWQGATFGLPTNYTIDNGVIYFDVPFEDDLAGENIYMDYYQELQASNSDSDLLDEPFYDLFLPWLRWKIKYLKSNGKLNPKEDGDYAEWVAGKDRVISQEIMSQDIYLTPA